MSSYIYTVFRTIHTSIEGLPTPSMTRYGKNDQLKRNEYTFSYPAEKDVQCMIINRVT